ncbi:hypothetical protein PUNSTDRAFT_46406 [Punctularia strigosozonata HHB-11173 SS5]|uniref:uncharacterized protein n=1 Tax=Punctularia strigosozonata (strain HHB-11173) TaxID=741275 RepID=UPI0004417B08|nr:uncharacterized protein PUNSTDRAFT_46406 [Punctularia strigosozonata HHB-11173 SS5]EIN06176.1 hypothetical protein PUNSTDRAFT_46406 [Punctularia strigosozonata HHB-11173 SS5]
MNFAADIDWCLSCSRHTDGTSPYCSDACYIAENPHPPAFLKPAAAPDTDIDDFALEDDDDRSGSFAMPSTSTHWPGTSPTGIAAWAALVPAGAPPSSPPPPSTSTSTPSSTSASSSRKPSPTRSPRSLRPSALNSPPAGRPSICLSRPQAAPCEPTLPIATPVEHLHHHLHLHRPTRDSLATLATLTTHATTATESAVPTPATSLKDLSVIPTTTTTTTGGPGGTGGGKRQPAFIRDLAHRMKTWGAGIGAAARASTPQIAVLDGLEAATDHEKARYLVAATATTDATDDDHDDNNNDDDNDAYDVVRFSVVNHQCTLPRRASRCALDDHPAFKTRGRKPRH